MKYIILDLDQTLIDTISRYEYKNYIDENYLDLVTKKYSHPKYCHGFALNKSIFYMFLRPGVIEFLEFCNDNFKIIIYTAAHLDYAKKILEILCSYVKTLKIEQLLHRDHLKFMPYLNKSIKSFDFLSGIHPQDCLIIDDIDFHYSDIKKKNLILVKEWYYFLTDDDELIKIIKKIKKELK
jgi:hypothetical protein